ncbi:methyltransferase [Pedobacter sp. MR2016-24]|uniref:methyltransferase n=1 Tax=Pedobacter sp. MR2016-24 TaxID=2994466 RepID=UPI002245CA0C|nr:methyltransferase [Pedobacter sp. MR2016-24]MCX2483522.1 methyltransferase [Pedobacter sp. MR2016-24]
MNRLNTAIKQMPQKPKKYFVDHKSVLHLGGQSLFPSVGKQEQRLDERKVAEEKRIELQGLSLLICAGVYKTGVDTELMIETTKQIQNKKFLEIGCGCGAISIYLAKNNKTGIAVDINELAVENTLKNCQLNNITNLQAQVSNVFENVKGKFDVIFCNPPYNEHDVRDNIDRMFWDPQNSMKEQFFMTVKNHLKKTGSIYFGWADFADLNFEFPISLAKLYGFKLVKTYSRPSSCSSFRFIVFKFKLA